MIKKKVLIIFGTRPEAIKMAPVVHECLANKLLDTKVCVTGQHREMLDQVLSLFDIEPDYDLNIMKKNQTLSSICSDILSGLESIFKTYKPDLILVHGDTSTTFASSLAAFYHQIGIAHVEAGLRTNDLYSPWPEEGNRRLTGVLTNLHFAPTEVAQQNLLREGVESKHVTVTGNTVIDALFYALNKIKSDSELLESLVSQFEFIPANKKIILVTAHRRENHGKGFEVICDAIAKIAKEFAEDVHFVYPVHLNPKVQEPVKKYLSDISNISLIAPLDYLPFVYLMDKSYIILTDSGGVQEEAPSLGKPVLLLRDTTERPEAVSAGTVRLVGAENADTIVAEVSKLINDQSEYDKMSGATNPYGDGKASQYISQAINDYFNLN